MCFKRMLSNCTFRKYCVEKGFYYSGVYNLLLVELKLKFKYTTLCKYVCKYTILWKWHVQFGFYKIFTDKKLKLF